MIQSHSDEIVHVRADKGQWDFDNIFWRPFKELLRFRELIGNIVARDLKVRYKRSILGVAWTVVAPLMSMTVMWAVFTLAFGVQMPNYAVYLLSGIILWNLFIQSSAAGCSSILQGAGLIRKVKLPRVIFPISVVVNNLVNFAFAFMALLLVILVTRAPIHWTILLVPVMLVPPALFCLGWAMMVSAFGVFFRDLQYILEIFLGAMFYMTPILWKPEQLPAVIHTKIRGEVFDWSPEWIVSLNPMAKYIHLFRSVVYHGEIPGLRVYGIALGMGFFMFVLGWVVFQKLQRKFVYWL